MNVTATPDSPFLSALRKSGRFAPQDLATAEDAFSECQGNSASLALRLKAAGLLTHYQFRKLQANRAADLVFGKYLIFDKIGEGGMGKVYRACDTALGREVALKVVRPHLLANKMVVKRYRREVSATAAFDHQNIVHLYDADDVNGRHYLAVEYVDGSDLARLVKECGPLDPFEVCEYARQTALGLHHAHERGFVHRDIKPSNLLVSGERALPRAATQATVKILDMGLVRCLENEEPSLFDLTRDNTVVGTPDYMAPEQANDSTLVDGRADFYSLGCTMLFLLTGKPPFTASTAMGRLIAHQRNPVPKVRSLRSDVPQEVAAIIERLMSKNPDRRPSSGAELAYLLGEVLHGKPAKRPIGRPETFQRPNSQPRNDLQSNSPVGVDEDTPIRLPRLPRFPSIWAWSLAIAGILVPIASAFLFLRR